MDIVDAQVHIGPGRIEESLAAMDALGIRAILIDEYWMGKKTGDPAYPVADGARQGGYRHIRLVVSHPAASSRCFIRRSDSSPPA